MIGIKGPKFNIIKTYKELKMLLPIDKFDKKKKIFEDTFSSSEIDILQEVLYSTFDLYFCTHVSHWNIIGDQFYSLHKLLQKQYEELFNSIDDIAERIRSLGEFVNPNYTLYHKNVVDSKNQNEMLSKLISMHEIIISKLKTYIKYLNDYPASQNVLIDRLAAHEKHIWMLKSHS